MGREGREGRLSATHGTCIALTGRRQRRERRRRNCTRAITHSTCRSLIQLQPQCSPSTEERASLPINSPSRERPYEYPASIVSKIRLREMPLTHPEYTRWCRTHALHCMTRPRRDVAAHRTVRHTAVEHPVSTPCVVPHVVPVSTRQCRVLRTTDCTRWCH